MGKFYHFLNVSRSFDWRVDIADSSTQNFKEYIINTLNNANIDNQTAANYEQKLILTIKPIDNNQNTERYNISNKYAFAYDLYSLQILCLLTAIQYTIKYNACEIVVSEGTVVSMYRIEFQQEDKSSCWSEICDIMRENHKKQIKIEKLIKMKITAIKQTGTFNIVSYLGWDTQLDEDWKEYLDNIYYRRKEYNEYNNMDAVRLYKYVEHHYNKNGIRRDGDIVMPFISMHPEICKVNILYAMYTSQIYVTMGLSQHNLEPPQKYRKINTTNEDLVRTTVMRQILIHRYLMFRIPLDHEYGFKIVDMIKSLSTMELCDAEIELIKIKRFYKIDYDFVHNIILCVELYKNYAQIFDMDTRLITNKKSEDLMNYIIMNIKNNNNLYEISREIAKTLINYNPMFYEWYHYESISRIKDYIF